MPTIHEALRSRLLAHGGASALLGTRVFPDSLPEGAAYPAVVYRRIDSPRDHSHSGESPLAEARFQFDVWGVSRKSVEEAATQVRLALDRFVGLIGGTVRGRILLMDQRDDRDPTTGEYRAMQDYSVVHEEV